MQHSALGQRGVHHRSLYAFPILGITLAHHYNIDRDAQRTQRSAEPHHLGMPIADVALDRKEVEIAVRPGIPACMRSEEDHLDRILGSLGQLSTSNLDDILRNHDDTVSKRSAQADRCDPAWVAEPLDRGPIADQLMVQPSQKRPKNRGPVGGGGGRLKIGFAKAFSAF